MDLGTAIKTIRKQKKMTAKTLATKVGISANAMCCIEVNRTFPAKETLRKICVALEIPSAYLLFFSISDEDLPDRSKALFNALFEPLKNVLLEEINTQI